MKSCMPPISGYMRDCDGEIGVVFGPQNKDMAEELNRKSIDKVNTRTVYPSGGSTS